jgi:hypothetical protein
MRAPLTLLLTLTLTLTLAGCGGDQQPADVAASLAEEVDTQVDGVDTEEAIAAAEEAADTAASAVEELDTSGAIDADACRDAARALTAVPQTLAQQGDAEDIESASQALEDLDVPEEHADDLQVIADAHRDAAAALEGIELDAGSTPTPEQQAAFEEAAAAVGTEAYATAVGELSQFFAAGCQ